jgi:hypothetical protein
MNDPTVNVGDQVQMTLEGRKRFKPPYSGQVVGKGRNGGLFVLQFGEKEAKPFRPRYWRPLGFETPAVDKVLCPGGCGKKKPAEEMDACLGCSSPYEMCPECLLTHECRAEAV